MSGREAELTCGPARATAGNEAARRRTEHGETCIALSSTVVAVMFGASAIGAYPLLRSSPTTSMMNATGRAVPCCERSGGRLGKRTSSEQQDCLTHFDRLEQPALRRRDQKQSLRAERQFTPGRI